MTIFFFETAGKAKQLKLDEVIERVQKDSPSPVKQKATRGRVVKKLTPKQTPAKTKTRGMK